MVREQIRPIRCAITANCLHTLGSERDRTRRLRAHLQAWAAAGLDMVQLREKSLDPGELFRLTVEALAALRALPHPEPPRLLVNSRADLAAAAGADGVHLTARPGELTPAQVRAVFAAAGLPRCLVSVSCHNGAEVAAACAAGADLILFGPVFEKRAGGEAVVPGQGLVALGEACSLARPVPLLALGGVTERNLRSCLDAGAAGVAGIRLFA